MRIIGGALSVIIALAGFAAPVAQSTSGTFTNGQTLFEECLVYAKFSNSDMRPTLIQAD
jgi:hypothetical protein